MVSQQVQQVSISYSIFTVWLPSVLLHCSLTMRLLCWTWLVTPSFVVQKCAISQANFYCAMLCISGTSHGLCLSVCLSITSRCSTKTAKHKITKTTPHDRSGTLVFWCQRSPRNSTGITPVGGAKGSWVGQNRWLSTNSWLYLENGTR